MRRLSLWAGVGALALAAIIGAACSVASSQEPTATPVPLGTTAPPATPQMVEGVLFHVPTPKPEAEVVYIGPIDVPAVAMTFDTGVQAGHLPASLARTPKPGLLPLTRYAMN
jgi:hypothetical protein